MARDNAYHTLKVRTSKLVSPTNSMVESCFEVVLLTEADAHFQVLFVELS